MTAPADAADAAGSADSAAAAGTAWGPLLDRLEERLRLISLSVQPAAPSASGPAEVDLGPPPGPDDLPSAVPTASERLRLLALHAAHDQLVTRLEGRRRALRQAQQYRLGAA